MAKDNETTLKLRADISELKKEFQEAQRTVRVANAEFNAATAGMDNWAESADGLSSKVNQLSKVLEAEKIKQENLNAQYEKTVKLQGENSKGAQELLVKLNNQKATVAKVEKELNKWQIALDEVGKENTDIVQTISKQEKELASLKDQYAKIVVEQGKESAAAKKLESQISELSGELKQNKKAYSDASKEADKFDETLDDSEENARKAAEGFTVMKGAIASLIADGIKAAVSALKDMTTELMSADKAYNNFQTQTGKSAEEMAEFKDEINEVYKKNLGESLEDVADAMAKVAQSSKETDPSKIKELTENALVLRDTFGYDINETMRAVNMLMDQFGISGDEAFNLIIQGAQKGLDKNGDLLDSINEYSVHYKQLGYDADDFFNSLANGTDAGTFSVDKLGDAMKEFGIRTKDTAKSTTEGFEAIGLNANLMRKEFAKGGESAQKATKKTLKALFEMKDEVKQNEAGVALFGTMWEDLGKEGVKALMDTQGELTSTKKSMEEIKQIKYDDVMNDISALGRQFKMDVLLPLIQDAMPQIRSAIKWVSENLDALVPIIAGVGAAIATAFIINKIATFAQSIQTLIPIVQSLTLKTQAQTAAQTALNATNPFGWVALAVSGIALLVPAIVGLINKSENLSKKYTALNAEEQKLRDETNKLTESYKNWDEAKRNTIANTGAEFGYYSELASELKGIVDENGKIKKGYEDRATVITGILSKALGTEIEITNGVIQKYDELKTSIDEVIVAKKAEAMLNALEQDYITAIQNKDAALQNYTANQKLMTEQLAEYQALEAKVSELVQGGVVAYAKKNDMLVGAHSTQKAYDKELENARAQLHGVGAKLAEQTEKTQESEEAYTEFISTIKNYEGVSAAIVSGDSKKITDSLTLLEKGFKTAETGTKKSLETQTANYKSELANLKQAIKDKTPGVTQEQVDQMEKLVEKSEAELAKLAPKAEKQGEKGAEGFADGVEGKKETAKNSGEKVAEKAEEGLESADSKSVGENFTKGFGEGLSDKKGTIWDKAWALGKKAIDAVRKATDTNSPSREAMAVGKFFSEGFANGIIDGSDEVYNSVSEVAQNTLGRLSSDLVYDKLITATKKSLDSRYNVIKKSLDNEVEAFRDAQEKELKVMKKTQDDEVKALKDAQAKSLSEVEKAQEKELNSFERTHKKKLKLIDKEYTEKLKLVDEEKYNKIKAIEDEIAKIEGTTEAEEKALKKEEEEKRKAELREQIRKAETYEERMAAEQELAEYEKQLAREKLLEERKLKVESLNNTKEKINEEAEAQKKKLEEEKQQKIEFENAGYEATKEILQKQWDDRKTALKEEQALALENLQEQHDIETENFKKIQDKALENLRERHSVYLENVKEELDAELDSLKQQKEAAIALIKNLNIAKTAEIGSNIIEGLTQAMANGTSSVFGTAFDIGLAALDGLKKSTDTHSPSREAMKIGEFFSQGLGLGIEDGESDIIKSIKALATDITETLSDELDFSADLLSPLSADIGQLSMRDFRSNAAVPETKNVTNVTNFYQTNNSPKALSRTEIYRQTKNQLAFAGGAK